MAALAGRTGCVGLVSESSNSFRSFIKPALHVGKQIGGGLGCRACTGRAGIAGAATTGGGKFGDTLAQPVTSIAGGNSISTRLGQVLFSFINDPLQRLSASLLFGPCGCNCLPGSPLHGGEKFGMARSCGGVLSALVGQA